MVSHYFLALLLYRKRQNFKLVQNDSICRQQLKYGCHDEMCLSLYRRHCGKRRKYWLPAFSPFLTRFPKGFFLRVVKTQNIEVKGSYQSTVKIWLVVLRFNATLTAKVVSWQLVMHMCFLANSHQY